MVPALEARGYHVETNDVAGELDVDMPFDCREIFATGWPGPAPDLVVHLAANIGGRAVIDGSPLAVATNLALDSMLFEWAQRVRPGRVLYFSSSAAYPVCYQARGTHYQLDENFIDLADICLPDATYGWAKLTGEMLAGHARAAGVPVTVVRPFSGYGEDQALDYPFPSFIARAAARQGPFDIWGAGDSARDWIHIDDVIEGALTLVDEGIDGPINLCTGIPTTFDDLAAAVCSVAGYQPDLNHVPTAPQGVHWRVGDPNRLRTYYQPRISLRQGIERALATANV